MFTLNKENFSKSFLSNTEFTNLTLGLAQPNNVIDYIFKSIFLLNHEWSVMQESQYTVIIIFTALFLNT
jgi:hypothetical protein